MEVPGGKVGHDTALLHGSLALSDCVIPAGEEIASALQLPPGQWPTLLDGLCARFPRIGREQWQDRFARGRVLDAERQVLSADAPYRVGRTILYFREVIDEPVIPFEETLVHVDEHLVVVDKPHFLPVAPTGRHVRETLLTRLVGRLGIRELVPLHRIDRDTAGLVLFSVRPDSRGAYQELFRRHRIEKRYEAVAPALPGCVFPLLRETRLVKSEPFFRMQEVEGEANARTLIEVLAGEGEWWRYALFPVSGRKHQLRVHMAALGAPIRNDPYYPGLTVPASGDYSRPLQLLAKGLSFVDPLTGLEREFESRRELEAAT
ncbi:pseudouridine synthase [Pseudoxanthomonas yeongjuensis]|nr:pseudouridine synthase [Pseudoxanthomonas yeongjuensis]